jgi:hypothetical protein
MLYLHRARTVHAVRFHGPTDTTLESKHGTLVWDPELQCVRIRADNRPSLELLIPSTNLVFMEAMSDYEAVDYLEKREARSHPKPPEPAAPVPEGEPAKPPAKDDRIVYVKDPKTGEIVEQRASK